MKKHCCRAASYLLSRIALQPRLYRNDAALDLPQSCGSGSTKMMRLWIYHNHAALALPKWCGSLLLRSTEFLGGQWPRGNSYWLSPRKQSHMRNYIWPWIKALAVIEAEGRKCGGSVVKSTEWHQTVTQRSRIQIRLPSQSPEQG
jgi:hypothetical protein